LVAKSLVASGLCRRCHIQLSYQGGWVRPIISLDSHGSANGISDKDLAEIVRKNFDLRPGALANEFGMRRPIFRATAFGGHFGRPEFPWENPKKLKLSK